MPLRFLLLMLGCAFLSGPVVGCGAHVGAPGQQSVVPHGTAEPNYQPLSSASFRRAALDGRLVLLSVQASWCHFCHVMNAQTLADPEVLGLLRDHFVVIRVDADARPDVAERYAAWGWPATIVLTAEGQDVRRLRGYRKKAPFAAMLRDLSARHQAGESLALGERAPRGSRPPCETEHDADLAGLRDRALAQLQRAYDPAVHGYGGPKKYPHTAPVEVALLRRAVHGSDATLAPALASLQAYRRLIDPVAGGAFQYSVFDDWQRPHYEKIHRVQANLLETFAHAYQVLGDGRWLDSAKDMARYLLGPLRAPSGALFANQDADVGRTGEPGHLTGEDYYRRDTEARALVDAPRIDRSIYANYNGLSIAALGAFHVATGDRAALAAARAAHDAIERTHRVGELYSHAPGTTGMLHLSDQVEMARALLSLHQATAEAGYLKRLSRLIRTVDQRFYDGTIGSYRSHTGGDTGDGLPGPDRYPLRDNARMAQVLLRFATLEGREDALQRAHAVLRAHADRADALLVPRPTPRTPDRVALRTGAADYALALESALANHVLLTVVGPVADPRTDALLTAARAYDHPARVLRHDAPGEGKYPYPDAPVLYLCSRDACSAPIQEPAAVAEAARAFGAPSRRDPSVILGRLPGEPTRELGASGRVGPREALR